MGLSDPCRAHDFPREWCYMPGMETENIILEHLRAMRAKIDRIEATVLDLRDQFVSFRLREHAKDGDLVRHDRQIAHLQDDVERIKRRLDLVDAKD